MTEISKNNFPERKVKPARGVGWLGSVRTPRPPRLPALGQTQEPGGGPQTAWSLAVPLASQPRVRERLPPRLSFPVCAVKIHPRAHGIFLEAKNEEGGHPDPPGPGGRGHFPPARHRTGELGQGRGRGGQTEGGEAMAEERGPGGRGEGRGRRGRRVRRGDREEREGRDQTGAESLAYTWGLGGWGWGL